MEREVDLLPEELRTVFVLRDIEEQSNAEVAEVLELTVAGGQVAAAPRATVPARPPEPVLRRQARDRAPGRR